MNCVYCARLLRKSITLSLSLLISIRVNHDEFKDHKTANTRRRKSNSHTRWAANQSSGVHDGQAATWKHNLHVSAGHTWHGVVEKKGHAKVALQTQQVWDAMDLRDVVWADKHPRVKVVVRSQQYDIVWIKHLCSHHSSQCLLQQHILTLSTY